MGVEKEYLIELRILEGPHLTKKIIRKPKNKTQTFHNKILLEHETIIRFSWLTFPKL